MERDLSLYLAWNAQDPAQQPKELRRITPLTSLGADLRGSESLLRIRCVFRLVQSALALRLLVPSSLALRPRPRLTKSLVHISPRFVPPCRPDPRLVCRPFTGILSAFFFREPKPLLTLFSMFPSFPLLCCASDRLARHAAIDGYERLPKPILFDTLKDRYNFDRLLRSERRNHSSGKCYGAKKRRKPLYSALAKSRGGSTPSHRSERHAENRVKLNDIDPIMMVPIGKAKTFVFTRPNGTQVQFLVDSLADYLLSTGDFTDPETRIPFSDEDLASIDRLVRRTPFSSSFVFCLPFSDPPRTMALLCRYGGLGLGFGVESQQRLCPGCSARLQAVFGSQVQTRRAARLGALRRRSSGRHAGSGGNL